MCLDLGNLGGCSSLCNFFSHTLTQQLALYQSRYDFPFYDNGALNEFQGIKYVTTSCKNVETLSRKNNLSCFKSLLVTGL